MESRFACTIFNEFSVCDQNQRTIAITLNNIVYVILNASIRNQIA